MTRTPVAHAAEPSYPLFDWLRFLLASVVVLVHSGLTQWPEAGDFAVCVFFALSGWLIGGILLRTPVSGLPRFYFNRGFRIWIPYAAAIALLYTVAMLREGMGGQFFQFLFYDVTFTHYWFFPKIPEITQIAPLHGTGAHFWSISVEEQFYLFAPLILVFLPWGRSVLLWVGLCLLALVVDYHYACIAFGVLAILLKNRFGSWHSSIPVQAVLGGALLLGFVTIVQDDVLYRYLAPLTALLVVLLCARDGSRSAVAQFLGGVSYPLYLNHWVGIFAANLLHKHVPLSPALHVAAAFALAVTTGILAYLLVDRWVLKLRQSLYKTNRGLALMVTAYALLVVGVLVQFLWLEPLGNHVQ